VARRADPAVKVLTLMRGMTSEVRATVLALAREEFRVPAAATKVTRKRRLTDKAAFIPAGKE
jgi:hypothetical protein